MQLPVYILDLYNREKLQPFSTLNSIATLNFGIYSNLERWELYLKKQCQIIVPEYLQPRYPIPDFLKNTKEKIYLNANIIPTVDIVEQIIQLEPETTLIDINGFIASRTNLAPSLLNVVKNFRMIPEQKRLTLITDLLKYQAELINEDFKLLSQQIKTQAVPAYCAASGIDSIIIEEDSYINPCFLNAQTGPIIIRKGAEIMEGASIRGPIIMQQDSCIKMNSTIYGTVTLGKKSVIGGEVKNSIIMDYSNKAHHGYLGDSIVGKWCNLGAGVTNSNLKNNCQNVKLHFPGIDTPITVGNKMGCLIGDYSKLAIEVKINTGTYIGNACNIFNNIELPKMVPDFTWGVHQSYKFNKLKRDLQQWASFKRKDISETEFNIMKHFYHNQNL